ncbi:THOC7 [Cordylochernes scorpioides]|uniref:THOC7 n=1 Tax=Cordylochernes scorpioides TaxID=51811 RepID=A0ABY6LNR4_9ARAC|nr:THOC7 [Cordylochernes scorpioides]
MCFGLLALIRLPSQPATPRHIIDYEVYRRKLLIDGDGNGDDSRINNFLKMCIKWCMLGDETPEERLASYEKLLLTLSQCECCMEKSQQVQDMNHREMANYEELYNKIEAGISQAQQQILDCKADLQQAKRIRRNKQEYDGLAKIIEGQPDRRGTLAKLQTLSEEIQALQRTRSELDRNLEQRRRQFQLLLGAVYQLQTQLNEEGDQQALREGTTSDAAQPMDTV